MKKDNKGFTLIELLIVITIILSITAIGVVSFINISKARKQEAYEDVKNQVVTAAEQYFSSNAYYLNDITSGTIQVGVGKLVAEDYMNTVVNPVTGNKLNICDKIVVTKEGSRVNYEYVETSDSTCDGGNVIAVREAGAPKISLTYYNLKDEKMVNVTDGWLNYSKLDGNVLRVNVKADANNNGAIVSIESSHPNEFSAPGDSTIMKNQNFFDGEYTNVTYTVTNSAGKKATETISFKIDATLPTGDITVKSKKKKYNSNNVDIIITVNDNFGVKSYNIMDTNGDNIGSNVDVNDTSKKEIITPENLADDLNGQTLKYTMDIEDIAGNKNTIDTSYVIYKVCSAENILTSKTLILTGTCQGACNSMTQKNTYKIVKTDKNTYKNCGEVIEYTSVSCTKPCTIPECSTISVSGATEGFDKWYKGTQDIKYSNSKCIGSITTSSNNFKLSITSANLNNYKNNGYNIVWYKNNDNVSISKGKESFLLADGEYTNAGYKITDKDGNTTYKTCNFKNDFGVDTNPPTITFTVEPKVETCNGSQALQAKFDVSDITSGIAKHAHYWGSDICYDLNSEKALYEPMTASSSLSSTWGFATGCYTKSGGKPSWKKTYIFKAYASDKAGNVTTKLSTEGLKFK